MSQRLVLFAKYILTMDRPQPIEDGFVLIQGSRILQVGKRKDLYFLPSVRFLDLGETVLLPGFINAHCHLDFTLFKGPRSIEEVKLDGPIVYVKLYGATGFDIQYTNYRQPY